MSVDDEPPSCMEVVDSLMRISTPRAIDVTRTVELGGIPQVVSIRGTDSRNPVLLLSMAALGRRWRLQGGCGSDR